jgi:hypothetical protein
MPFTIKSPDSTEHPFAGENESIRDMPACADISKDRHITFTRINNDIQHWNGFLASHTMNYKFSGLNAGKEER